MKRGGKKKSAQKKLANVGVDFTRGFVATGLLSLFQDRDRLQIGRADATRILRHALQGGVALSAGSAAAEAVRQQDYATAMTALAGGAVGVLAIEKLLRRPALINPIEGEEA